MRAWPVLRPTHAPATAIRIKRNNTQTIVIPEFSGAAPAATENIRNLRRKAGWPPHRSSGGILHTLSRGACVPDRSRANSPPQHQQENQNPSCRPLLRRHGAPLPWSPRAADYPPLAFPPELQGLPELGNDTEGGALLPFVLRVVAGAGISGASRDAFPSGAWERQRRQRTRFLRAIGGL